MLLLIAFLFQNMVCATIIQNVLGLKIMTSNSFTVNIITTAHSYSQYILSAADQEQYNVQ